MYSSDHHDPMSLSIRNGGSYCPPPVLEELGNKLWKQQQKTVQESCVELLYLRLHIKVVSGTVSKMAIGIYFDKCRDLKMSISRCVGAPTLDEIQKVHDECINNASHRSMLQAVYTTQEIVAKILPQEEKLFSGTYENACCDCVNCRKIGTVTSKARDPSSPVKSSVSRARLYRL